MPSVNSSPIEWPLRKVKVRLMLVLKIESAALGTCDWEAMKPGPKINPGAGSAPRSQIFASPVLVASSPGEIAGVGGGGGGGGGMVKQT